MRAHAKSWTMSLITHDMMFGRDRSSNNSEQLGRPGRETGQHSPCGKLVRARHVGPTTCVCVCVCAWGGLGGTRSVHPRAPVTPASSLVNLRTLIRCLPCPPPPTSNRISTHISGPGPMPAWAPGPGQRDTGSPENVARWVCIGMFARGRATSAASKKTVVGRPWITNPETESGHTNPGTGSGNSREAFISKLCSG